MSDELKHTTRLLADMPEALLADLRKRKLFCCHQCVLYPDGRLVGCTNVPVMELTRPNGVSSLLCKSHASSACREMGMAEPNCEKNEGGV